MSKHRKAAVHGAVIDPLLGSAGVDPDECSIAALAYQLWLSRGCPLGSDQDDWFLAESMLKRQSGEPSVSE